MLKEKKYVDTSRLVNANSLKMNVGEDIWQRPQMKNLNVILVKIYSVPKI